ncbi:hypothetical protein PC9H_008034 [Pleurotus ostreatus]|uniref:Uncharacterized protein n=2 Tax=Pleurotus ostreatus TaxID=5322 RepID=A0A8H6ZZB5_PLEOS|nr:uncharacterized protein PC9H_008034 [Pleurotus ostreatus]KAF7428802.1 hypothetical protein PC9H_008034 [Pleurotus ostreatus]KAJ8697023.1 hypothetical protein PTI98_006836 [Pleurotus ostreatus]
MTTTLHRILAIAALFLVAAADESSTRDPYLDYKPAFASSLPVQILLTGIVLTLVAVLFIHLIFTAQYHWPLAPVNYVLQISGVTTLLISLIATLHVVLSATLDESKNWPYMLSYIAVDVPPSDSSMSEEHGKEWTTAEKATWMVMNASTSGLIQITHIQFLTLLYPSRLEGRLIFLLLGPLAILSAVMQLLPIHGSEAVLEVASAVRNVCNATLSLLFTAALFIWGLLVNRKQAWRTDGGTAAFGAAALLLAVASTALTFLYVPREEEYVWLPGLMWAIILWQSFLGWWWWVGAGSAGAMNGWDGMEEEMIRREKREKRRKAKLERRKERSERAKLVLRGVAGAFGKNTEYGEESRGRHGRRGGGQRTSRSGSRSGSPSSPTSPPDTRSRGLSSASTTSVSTTPTYATLPNILPSFIHQWYASLSKAHVAAARKQAAERAERIRELDRSGSRRRTANRHKNPGWGLGSFGWRTRTQHQEDDTELDENRIPHETRRSIDHSDGEDGPQKRRNAGRREMDDRNEFPPFRGDNSTPAHNDQQPASSDRRQQSLWWWGPLSRWRLQDSTVY